MIVAGLPRDFTFDQPARGLEIEHEDLRLQERRRDVLAFFDFSRSSSATMMPSAQNRPAQRSAIGMPTRTGPAPAGR